MSIKNQVQIVKESLKNYPNVHIVAATKYFNVKETEELIKAGITEIAENRKDAFLEKYNALKDYHLTWHYFGNIKIPPKLYPDFVDAIDYLHSLNSLDLANAINNARTKEEPLKCFVCVNIAGTQNKAGLDETKVVSFVKSLAKYKKIQVVGLMTTGKNTFDEDLIISYFEAMRELQEEIQELHLDYAPCTELSMGMSNDYLIAVEHGSTFVRLGTIFTE